MFVCIYVYHLSAGAAELRFHAQCMAKALQGLLPVVLMSAKPVPKDTGICRAKIELQISELFHKLSSNDSTQKQV